MQRSGKPVVFLWTAALVVAFCLSASPVSAAGRIGIVLMHGKGGTCEGTSPCAKLKNALTDKGYLVDAPVMPWGKGRVYDRDYEQSMAEIDGLVRALKSQGAQRIVVAGHSMGGNAALGYAVRHPEIAGVIALAAGHQPENPYLMKHGLKESLAEAKSMIAAGKGDERATFVDFNMGRNPKAHTTANIYYSWFAPDGPANMITKAQQYNGSPPMLWLDTRTEQNPHWKIRQRLVAIIRTKPDVTYGVLDTDHFNAPPAAISTVLVWLDKLQ